MKKISTGTILFSSLFTISTLKAETQKHHHEAHSHGHASMKIIQDDNKIEIQLEIPGEDVVGFEYSANTEAQRNLVEKAQNLFAKADNVFEFSKESSCTTISSKAEIQTEHKDHSELEAAYSFKCKNALKSIKVKVFQALSKLRNKNSLKEIDYEYFKSGSSKKGELTPTDTKINF